MKKPSNVGIGLSFDSGVADGSAAIDSLSNLLFSFASLFGNIPANAYKVSTTSSSSFVIGPVTLFLGDLSEPPCFFKNNSKYINPDAESKKQKERNILIVAS